MGAVIKNRFCYSAIVHLESSIRCFIVAVSIPGDQGTETRSRNQDAVRWRSSRSVAVVAVADGLGSCPRSDVGARMATLAGVEVLTRSFRSNLTATSPNELGAQIRSKWIERLGHAGPLSDFDTTLLLAGYGHGRLVLCGVGDGLVLVSRACLPSDNYMPPKHTFGNQTASLKCDTGQPLWTRELEIPSSSLPLGVLLATDGVADDLEPASVPLLLPTLVEMINGPGLSHTAETVVSWLEQWPMKGLRDDRSLVLMVVQE